MKRLAGIISMLALTGCAAFEPATSQQTGWAGAWGASPTIPPAGGKAFENQTVRQIVRLMGPTVFGSAIYLINMAVSRLVGLSLNDSAVAVHT